jgi:muconolactone delta-isomerase
MGELGLRLDDSPIGVDSNPKVRLPELNPNNLRANFGLSLGFGLTSTLFPIGNFGLPLIKEGEVQKMVPLFNKDAGSLADIKNDVNSFVDKTRGEGGLKVYALGIITGDPTLLTAGAALFVTTPPVTQAFRELASGLKESGRDMLGAARDLARVAQRYGLRLEQTAKFLYENFSGGVSGVTSVLYNGITQNIGSIAYSLYNGVTRDLRSIARGIYSNITTNLDTISQGLYDGAVRDIDQIARAILDEFGLGFVFRLGNAITQFLPDGRKIRDIYQNGVRITQEVFRNLNDLAQYFEFFGDGVSTRVSNIYANGVRTIQRLWRSPGDLSNYFEFFGDGVSTRVSNIYANGVRTIQRLWRSPGDLSNYFEFFGDGVSTRVSDIYANGVRTIQRLWRSPGDLSDYIEFFGNGTSYKLRNFYEGGVNIARNIWGAPGDLAKRIEWSGNVQKEFEYVGGQINKYYEYVGGSLSKYWDTAQGWWDSLKGWLTSKPSWWPF